MPPMGPTVHLPTVTAPQQPTVTAPQPTATAPQQPTAATAAPQQQQTATAAPQPQKKPKAAWTPSSLIAAAASMIPQAPAAFTTPPKPPRNNTSTKESIVKDSLTEENEGHRRKISPKVKLQVQADQLRKAATERGLAAQKTKRLQTLDKFRGSNLAHVTDPYSVGGSNFAHVTDPDLAHTVTDDANDAIDNSADANDSADMSVGSTLSEFVNHLDDLESELRQDTVYNPDEEISL